jgi:hypothetical protein
LNPLKEEFKYLLEPTKGTFLLKNLRTAAGGNDAYPAIEEFIRELEKDNAKLQCGKGPLEKNNPQQRFLGEKKR